MNLMLRKLMFRSGPRLRSIFYRHFNRMIFRLNGVKFGKNLNVYDRFYLLIAPGGQMTVGNNFKFTSGDGINPLCRNIRGKIYIDKNAQINIGNNTGISSACLWAKEKITIGSNVRIGGDCLIMDTDAHNLDWRIRAGLLKNGLTGREISDSETANSRSITIEDNVLVGTRCIILKGVTIGARSIIAAGSVVTKDIPADCIAAGNPCRVFRNINES